MKVLVTGATGFIGSAVARQLLQHGYEVRALVRPASDLRNLLGLDLELFEGNLLDSDSLRSALTGVEGLMHVAADYRLWVPDPNIMYRTNVAATEDLMRLAMEAGVSRIVYTSSVATLGLVAEGGMADETTPVSMDAMIGPYKKSKFQAEAKVRELVAQQGLPAVIVNPSAPVGPRDVKPTPTGQTLVDAIAGRMPVYVNTGLNIVHVEDVALGHLLALEKGEPGRCYILGSENMSLRQLLVEVARQTHGREPLMALPHALVMPVALASEAWAKLTGHPTRITVDGVRLARKYMYFSSDRARRELGYRPGPALEAISAAIHWFTREGYC